MEFILQPGWMAVRLRPEWGERRRRMGLVSESRVGNSAHGVLGPPVWNGRQIAEVAYIAGWRDLNDLAMAVAVAFAECDGYINSHNDNLDDNGVVKSRDVGLWEMNIPASQIGTAIEKRLYNPQYNAEQAHDLQRAFGWGRWSSVSSGVVYDDTYVYRALLAVMNFAAEKLQVAQIKTPARAAKHSLTVPLVSTHQLHDLYPNVPQL